jgi:hypothetical protein
MDGTEASESRRIPMPAPSAKPRIDRIPAGLAVFGLTAFIFFVLVWAWPARGTGLWGPGVSTALAWGLFAFHCFLVRRHTNGFDPVIWIPVVILLYHTGAAISIEFLGSQHHTYDGLELGWGPPRLNQTYGVIILTLVSFLFGTHLAGFRDARKPLPGPPPVSMTGPGIALVIGGWLMSVTGIFVVGPGLLFGSYADMSLAKNFGMEDFRLWGTGNLFIQTGVFAIVASHDRRNPVPLRIAGFAAIYYVVAMLATGFRGHLSAFSFGSGWVLASRVWRIPHWLVISLFTTMLLLIPVMREFREYREVEEIGQYRSFRDFTAQAFYEMGSATQAVAVTIDMIPSQKPFDWGLSAVSALISNIPNFGRDVGLSWWGYAIGIDPMEHLPSKWFTATVEPTKFALRGGGYAFAMAAEWYWNFGFPGILLGLTWMGFMAAWLRNKGAESAFLMAATSLWIAMMSINVRNAMGYPSRMFLWGFVALLVLRLVFAALRPRAPVTAASAVPAGAHRRPAGP